MATVTGLTAERMIEIEDASIVDGDVVGGNLILTRHDGSQINAGSVVGPEGPVGPVGSDLEVLAAKHIRDVGLVDQIRAGRQLSPTDFANIGLSAPIGLWNLSDLTDVSGNGRNLLNKGAVPFGMGINGLAATAAVFDGTAAKGLYIADTGAADPFRLKTGSFGCWCRNAKRGLAQDLLSKSGAAAPLYSYILQADNLNRAIFYFSTTGTDLLSCVGTSDICDDRWHFVVVTYDGSAIKVYVDGILETTTLTSGLIFGSTGPLNIGGRAADASTNNASPFYGRIDEAFITSDILTRDQIRNLYCAKISHALGEIPARVTLNQRRRRKGPALVTDDFPSQPVRLYNFSAASLGNAGSQGAPGDLVNTGAVAIAGADGTPDNAFSFAGAQYLRSSDAGLPAGVTPVSVGFWIKSSNVEAANRYILTWGTAAGATDLRIFMFNGVLFVGSGGDSMQSPASVSDGNWHFVVIVHENAPADGVKRKLYIDGKLVVTSLILNGITLGGANKFVIGAALDATSPFKGQLDGVFVHSVAFTLEDILKLYTKGSQALAPSPKNPELHIEAMDANNVLALFDTLDMAHQIDLKVSA